MHVPCHPHHLTHACTHCPPMFMHHSTHVRTQSIKHIWMAHTHTPHNTHTTHTHRWEKEYFNVSDMKTCMSGKKWRENHAWKEPEYTGFQRWGATRSLWPVAVSRLSVLNDRHWGARQAPFILKNRASDHPGVCWARFFEKKEFGKRSQVNLERAE